MDGVHVKAVGPDHGLDLPTADPAPALAELERRRHLASDPGPTTVLPESVLLAKRAAFQRSNGGFWICNFANERLSTRCDRPNVRLLAFVRTREEGLEKVAEFMRDVRVKSIPCLVPANEPFLIPYSEAAAGNAAHTLVKIQRLAARHIDFCKYRDDDFKRSVEGKTPGETGVSDYHRRKTYLARQAQLRERNAAVDGAASSTTATENTPSLFREASASTSFGYDSVMGKIAESKRDKPSFGGGGAGGGDYNLLTASDAFEKACAATPLGVPSTQGQGRLETHGQVPSVPAPEPLWKGELPSHWKPRAGGDATVVNTAGDAAGDAVPVGTWPRELESRRGKHACLAFIDDMDKREDGEYPDASGMEPMVIVFGGEFEDVEAAKAVAKNDIGPWCTDLAIDIVDMYEWLWPTEIDPDAMTEEHRTSNAGYTKEANMIEVQRKKTLALTAEARAHAAAASIPLRETNANADLPEADAAVSVLRSGMFLHGNVVQLDNEGVVIGSASETDAATAPYGDLPEA
jgi:hypothetical protein